MRRHGCGGLFRLLAADGRTAELEGVRRFVEAWEGPASLRVRAGDPGVPVVVLTGLDDETLAEVWRFNVGTPLKGAPVVFAIGPKEYLAVQASGRHLHPVKYDNLEHSSYLFVFALN